MGDPIVLGLRHAEVENPDGVIYAGLDGFGLSEFGRRQAADAARALAAVRPVAVYASPLDRAIETASAVAEATGAEVVPDVRLHEWRHWQQWAGLTWEQLRDDHAETWTAYHEDPGSVTTGESLAELGARMTSWLEDVRERHASGVVVGVSHLEPLRAILLELTGRPPSDLFSIRVDLACMVRLWPDPSPDAGLPAELVSAVRT